jgi:flagellar biosynthesis protein FliR
MILSHFSAVLLFALFASIVFGITQRAQPKMMIRFGAYCFALFVGSVIVASWIMYAIKH